jgi:hypothetical protein
VFENRVLRRIFGPKRVYRVLMGKPEEKRPLGRPRRRWEDGINMDLGRLAVGVWGWIHLAQGRDRLWAVVNAVMNLRILAPHIQLCDRSIEKNSIPR